MGKTAAVLELARRAGEFGLEEIEFYQTSGSLLVAGQSGYGAWQERCQKLCREAGRTRSIICLGNIVELLEIGKCESNQVGIAGQLRGSMARGELLAIAECTPEQLAILEREDPHFLAVFRQVVMEEPPAAKVRVILQKVAAELTAGNPRRRGKDLRYVLELIRNAAPELLTPAAHAAKVMTDHLGDDHDLAILLGYVRASGAASDEQKCAIASLIEGRGCGHRVAALREGQLLLAERARDFQDRIAAYWCAASTYGAPG